MNTYPPKEMEQSILYRGTILQLMSVLEAIINSYIAEFFCGKNKDKRRVMQLQLLGDERITLSNKAQIFYALADDFNENWYKAYVSPRPKPKDSKKPYGLNSDLSHVIEQRNIFAHRMMAFDQLDKSHPRRKGVLRLVKLKSDTVPLDYDKNDFDELCKLILHLTNYIDNH
jgi:hypothetical protein